MDKLHLGIDLYLSGDLSHAINSLEEHIKEKGYDLGSAYYHLGLCYSDLNQQALAGENFVKAVEYSPEKSMYHYKLGLVYFRLMALDKASISLKKAIEINPEHQRARFLLGQVYFQEGNMDKAYKIFSDVIEKSHDFADAYYHRAMSSYQKGEDNKCLNDLEKAIEINNDFSDALLEASKIYYTAQNYTKAYDYAVKIYKKGVRTFSFIKLYLDILKKLEKDDYISIKEEARALFPNNQELENI